MPVKASVATVPYLFQPSDFAANIALNADFIATGLYLNILAYGGVPDGVTDNTAALTSALAALTGEGGTIFFPAGKYSFASQVAFNFPSGLFNVGLIGVGQDATELTWPASNGLVFNYANTVSAVHIRDLTLSTGQPNGGTAITLSLASAGSGGSAIEGPMTDFYRITMRGSDGYLANNYWTIGIQITNVSAIVMDDLTIMGTSSQQGAGVVIAGQSASSYSTQIVLSKSSFLGLNIGVSYGSFVQGLMIDQTNFTFVTDGISVAAGLSGALVELVVTGCQFNSGTVASGISIGLGTGLAGLQITDCFFVVGGPSQNAIFMANCEHYNIKGNNFQGINSTSSVAITVGAQVSGAGGIIASNDFYGFDLSSGTGISMLSTSGGAIITGNNFNTNVTGISVAGTGHMIANNFINGGTNGISLTSTSANCQVIGNYLAALSGSILNNNGTGNIIRENRGYNPVGISGPTSMGSSPFSYTAGASPETHYIVQTSGAAFLSKSGVTVASLQNNVYAVVELEPNETYSTTWNTTAPTYSKDVH